MQDVAAIVGGGTPSTKNLAFWNDGEIPWITPADLSGYDHKFISRGARNITRLGLERSGAVLLPAGAVLFSSRAPIGYVAIASNPVSTNQGFKSFVLAPGIEPDYIYYYLQFAKALAIALASGTTFQEISGQKARLIPVVVAPVAEQPRIVEAIESYLTRLDDAVASLKRARAKLKAHRASVLKAAVEGRLVPTEASLACAEKRDYEPADMLLARILRERRRRWEEAEIARLKAAGKAPKDDKWKAKYQEAVAPHRTTRPQLPEGWCWASVDQLTDGARNSGYGVLVPGPDVTDGVPLVRVGDIEDGTVSTSDLKRIDRVIADQFAKTYLRGGEVLLSLVGTIGRSAVVPSSLSGANVARAVGVIPTSSLVRSRWVEMWFRSPQIQALMNSRAHEVARKTLNLEDVRGAAVAVPPLAEQDRVLAQAEDLESVAAATASLVVANSLRSLRLRQAVLKWAFEGKLVDQDPTDEPAETLLARIRAARAALSAPKQTIRTRAKGAA
jgi:type I restriction enzyme S subunit